MQKIGLLVKETSEKQIKTSLKDSSAFFVIKYSGLKSPDLSSLRQALKKARASLFVVKNSTARRALKGAGLEGILSSIDGPCGLVFAKDEPVGTSKALCDFLKDHEKLVIGAGVLQDKILEKNDILEMAKLPSKEVLRAHVVVTLNAPIQKLVVVLNQTLRKFVYCMDQIRLKKEQK